VRACPSANESLDYGHRLAFHVSAVKKPVKWLKEPNSFSLEKEGGSIIFKKRNRTSTQAKKKTGTGNTG
jgi:hypothetical protein